MSRQHIVRPDDALARQVAVGARIAELRERAGITQREMAKAMQRSQTWLQAIEKGRNAIFAFDLERIAHYLDVPVSYVLDPDYDARAQRPKHRLDWDRLYPDEPELSALHAQIDRVYSGKAGGRGSIANHG